MVKRTPEGAGALENLRVLDVTHVMAGPFCAMMLSDLGADVIKVEPPIGDSARRMDGAVGTDSLGFNALNRGKRGIVMDLKLPEGQQAFRRLATTADVLIENNRPGVMARLGLDYATLAATNPGLIYASISGYGQTGPSSGKGGFDLIAQGLSGVMSVTGEPGRPPVKAGVPLVDLGAGLFALTGILAALHHRTRTGRGQHIDTSLLDAGIALSVWEAAEYFSGAGIPQQLGSAHRAFAPYQAIECADGYITLGAANDGLFGQLATRLGHPEWITDPAYATNTARVQNREALATRIEALTRSHSRRYWIEKLEAGGIPCGPINNYEEALTDEQVQIRSMVVKVDHPTLGCIRSLGSAIKLSGTPPVVSRRAPLLGEHTDDVLTDAGFSGDEIAELRRILAIG